MFEMFI